MQTGEMDRKRRLGYAIRRAREQRGMSPPELATRIGVARDTVNAWERGDSVPTLLLLGPLCEALRVKPELFAVLPDEPASPVDDFLLVVEATHRAADTARRPRRKPKPTDGASDG